ncbi:MAG: TRAP transporter large permease subunit [Leucobacter sp.]
MDNGTLVLAIVILLLVLLATRMPVAFALALSGAVGLLLLRDFDFATNMLGAIPFDDTAKFTLTVIPMFILMGMFAMKARIAEQVFALAAVAFRKLPGGLGVATVMACAGFAAVSGSSLGTTATMSKLTVGEMRKHGYPAPLATASVAVAGTLGVLIPPSIILVLYSIMASESVAKMFAAGIIPGVMSAIAYAIYMMFAGHRALKNRAESGKPTAAQASLEQALDVASGAAAGAGGTAVKTAPAKVETEVAARLRDLPKRGLVYVIILFVVVLGGMYSGIVTPTESAALGAIAAMLMLIIENVRSGPKQTMRAIIDALKETAGTTSMVFAIIVGSAILSVFFVAAGVPQMMTRGIVDAGLNPHLTIALLLLALLPLGMALESLSILVITVPLIVPVAAELGFDTIWIGILMVKMIEIGMVTPPVGISCFVVSGTSGVKVTEVFKGMTPFVLIDLLLVAVLFAIPQLTLWLPSLVVNY